MTATHPATATTNRTTHPSRTLTTPLVAASAAAALWCLARVLGVDLVVGSGTSRQLVGLLSVLVVAVFAAVAGAVAHRLLRRVTRRPAAWPLLAGLVLLVSLAGPAGAASPAAGVLLGSMHLAVGLVVIIGQPRVTGRR